MPIFNYSSPGLGAVGAYQVSGTPYLTGSGAGGLPSDSEHKIVFPTVARAVTVINMDAGNATIYVHFNPSSGSSGTETTRVIDPGNHFVPLTSEKDAITFACKCKEIYVSNPSDSVATYVIAAELTTIQPNDMFILSGSGLTD